MKKLFWWIVPLLIFLPSTAFAQSSVPPEVEQSINGCFEGSPNMDDCLAFAKQLISKGRSDSVAQWQEIEERCSVILMSRGAMVMPERPCASLLQQTCSSKLIQLGVEPSDIREGTTEVCYQAVATQTGENLEKIWSAGERGLNDVADAFRRARERRERGN